MSNNKFYRVLFLFTLFLTACSKQDVAVQQPAPIQIDVASVASYPVQNWHTFTTRLSSPEAVELRPRVSGVIESIEFHEGAQVQAGDLLVKLDDRPFKAEVSRLMAELNRAQAALTQADNEARRARSLVQSKALSTEESEARLSQAAQRRADVQALEAALASARLNLEFTQIRSPINGRISRALITKGNTVSANQSRLTTIVSTDRMYAYFDVDERTWNADFRQVTEDDQLPVTLKLTGSQSFDVHGTVDFIDNAINDNTGTLRVRAVISNEQGFLRTGAFARIRVASSDVREQVVVPDRAIGTDLKNRFVLTVNEQNQLTYTPVVLGKRFGEFRVIADGLAVNDRIAVNGPARVGPGMPVTPNLVSLDVPTSELTMNLTPKPEVYAYATDANESH